MTQTLPKNTIKIIDIAKYIYDKKINALASFELIKIACNDILAAFIDRDNNFITNKKYNVFVNRLIILFARYLFNEFEKSQLNELVYNEIKQILKEYKSYIKRKNHINDLQKRSEQKW